MKGGEWLEEEGGWGIEDGAIKRRPFISSTERLAEAACSLSPASPQTAGFTLN